MTISQPRPTSRNAQAEATDARARRQRARSTARASSARLQYAQSRHGLRERREAADRHAQQLAEALVVADLLRGPIEHFHRPSARWRAATAFRRIDAAPPSAQPLPRATTATSAGPQHSDLQRLADIARNGWGAVRAGCAAWPGEAPPALYWPRSGPIARPCEALRPTSPECTSTGARSEPQGHRGPQVQPLEFPMRRLQKHRQSAFAAQCGRCIYCRQPMGRHATAEHLKARQDGGTDRRDNIAAACRTCNHRRHADRECAALSYLDYATLVLIEKAAGLPLDNRAARPGS